VGRTLDAVQYGYGYNYEVDSTKDVVSDLAACLNGQTGSCMDVNTQECVGAGVLTGFCAGASNVKCCPGTVINAGPNDDTKKTGQEKYGGYGGYGDYFSYNDDSVQEASCLNGQAGSCVDSLSRACEGADLLTGFCAGAGHIKCCPPPGASKALNKKNGTLSIDDDDEAADVDHSKCYDQQNGGRCIDTTVFQCDGAATVTNLCPGAAVIRCCPGSGEPEPLESNICTFVPVLVSMNMIDDEKTVTDLVMKQSYRVNSGALSVPGGGDWWGIVVPGYTPVGFNETSVGPQFESAATEAADSENASLLVAIILVLIVVIVVGAVKLVHIRRQSEAHAMPTTAVMMNQAYVSAAADNGGWHAATNAFVFKADVDDGPVYAIPMEEELGRTYEAIKPGKSWVDEGTHHVKDRGSIYAIPLDETELTKITLC
jgi:hypothetical protein